MQASRAMAKELGCALDVSVQSVPGGSTRVPKVRMRIEGNALINPAFQESLLGFLHSQSPDRKQNAGRGGY